MKNARLFFACILMLGFLQVAARPLESDKTIIPFLEEEKRHVGSFSGVASAVPFNVYVTIGPKESLRLEGDSACSIKLKHQ